MLRHLPLLALLFLPIRAAAQDIYKYKDERGQWKFTNAPPSDLSHQGSIAPVPGPDCTPFKVGETRQLHLSTIWQSSPPLEVVGFGLRLIEIVSAPRDSAQFEWRLQMRNSATYQDHFWGTVKFLDCSGFVLGEASLPTRLVPPGPVVEFFGRAKVVGAMSSKIGVFDLAVRSSGVKPAEP
jgi:hypothetical protein